MGPLNNEPVAAKMDEHVRDALDRGAELVAGGARASGFPTTLYYEPTVLDAVSDEMEVARDETFGPIVPIRTISRRRTRSPPSRRLPTGSSPPSSRATCARAALRRGAPGPAG